MPATLTIKGKNPRKAILKILDSKYHKTVRIKQSSLQTGILLAFSLHLLALYKSHIYTNVPVIRL